MIRHGNLLKALQLKDQVVGFIDGFSGNVIRLVVWVHQSMVIGPKYHDLSRRWK